MRNWLIIAVVVAAALIGGAAMFSSSGTGLLGVLRGKAQAPIVRNDPAAVFNAPAAGDPKPLQGDMQPGKSGEGAGSAGAAGGDAEAKPKAPAEDKPAEDITKLSDAEKLKRIEEWKSQDPMEIIKNKYADLEGKETDPTNPDDPEHFIPETGRVDPLTPVDSALPEELRPPRTGETDANQFATYLFSKAATEAVDAYGYQIQVYNVIQIGLEKHATIRLGKQSYFIQEGDGFGAFYISQDDGIGVQVQVVAASMSDKEVVLSVTGTPIGSTVSITKSFNFIPSR